MGPRGSPVVVSNPAGSHPGGGHLVAGLCSAAGGNRPGISIHRQAAARSVAFPTEGAWAYQRERERESPGELRFSSALLGRTDELRDRYQGQCAPLLSRLGGRDLGYGAHVQVIYAACHWRDIIPYAGLW